MGPLVQNWWMMAVRGLLAVLFGIAILAWPHASLFTVVVLFCSYAILDGLWAIAAVVRASPRGPTREVWPLAAEGGASLGLGIPTETHRRARGVAPVALRRIVRHSRGGAVPPGRQCPARSVSAGAWTVPFVRACRLEARWRVRCAA